MSFWLILLCGLALAVLRFLLNKFQYWHRRGIKTWRVNAWLGNWSQLTTMHHTPILKELYERFKSSEKLAGFYIYTKPVAVIFDLDLIKAVLIKDFNAFSNRFVYKNDKDVLSLSLSFMDSAEWRPLRNKLTSTFTPGKMKYMFPTIRTVAAELKEVFDGYLKTDCVLNISDLSARFTIDNIGTCMLGIECNSLRDPQSKYRQIAAKITGTTDINARCQLFMQTYVSVVQFLGINVKFFPKCVEDFFMHFLKGHLIEREQLGIRHNDLLDLLIDVRTSKDEVGNHGLSHNEIIAQLFLFFAAGYETSANTLSFALYELARHPEIQDKVREEITSTLQKHNNELSYEASMEMPYLDQIISETIRLYPILSYLERTATQDYSIPNTKITLGKGTTVFIPVRSIHYDPEIYEDPTEFRPERFHPSEVAKRHPQSYLAFGDGPRNCIGLRLGRIQVVVALVSLLANYKFSVCPKTPEEFVYSDHTFALKSLTDIWLRVETL